MNSYLDSFFGQEGPGAIVGIISGLGVFLLVYKISLPFLKFRAKRRNASPDQAHHNAETFGTVAVMIVFVGLPFIAMALALSYFVLNLAGIALFHHRNYWPLILPGLAIVLGLILRWFVRSSPNLEREISAFFARSRSLHGPGFRLHPQIRGSMAREFPGPLSRSNVRI